jgi:hypothetical protein
MKNFLKKNHMFFIIIAAISIGAIRTVQKETDTSNIKITENYKKMECDKDIAENSSASLQYMICDYDLLPLTSATNRTKLYKFTQKNIDRWPVSRKDISFYFYKKIVESNPEDSLSIYLTEEKLQPPLKQPE